MTKLTLAVPSVGEKVTVAEPKVDTCFTTIQTWANGEIDSTNLKAEGIEESKLAKGLVEKLGGTIFGLLYEQKNESFEAANGKLYEQIKSAATVTLPAATAGRTIGIFVGAGTGCKVTASAGKIYGDFVTGATTVELSLYQHIIVEGNGSNWLIIAGEPKLETTYTNKSFSKAEAEAGVEPSATRRAQVSIVGTTEAGTVNVGGKLAGYFATSASCAVLVPPGVKWTANKEVTAMTIPL
jgi:hypothetical protein